MNEPINIIFQVQNFPYPIAVSVTVRYNKTLPWLVIYSIHLKICHPIAASVSPYIKTLPWLVLHDNLPSNRCLNSSPLYIKSGLLLVIQDNLSSSCCFSWSPLNIKPDWFAWSDFNKCTMVLFSIMYDNKHYDIIFPTI